MKKSILNILIFILYFIFYFSLFSRQLYLKGNIVHLYYLIGISLGVIIVVIINNLVLRETKTFISINCIMFSLMFLIFTFLTDFLFGSIFKDFYMKGYDNLFNLPEYFIQKI